MNFMKNHQVLFYFLSATILTILTLLKAFLFNYEVLLRSIGIGILILFSFFIRNWKDRTHKIIFYFFIVFSILFEFLFFFIDIYFIWIIAQFIEILFILELYIYSLYYRKKDSFGSFSFKFIFIGVLMLLCSVFMIGTVYSPLLMGIVQDILSEGNSYEIQKQYYVPLNCNNVAFQNVRYGKTYPNSYLDIYLSNHNEIEEKPTYIFLHGGGWFFGDKLCEDPFDKDNYLSFFSHFDRMLEAGYNVVSINYAFAPEYQFPTPILQLSEAIQYLLKNETIYGINMHKLILCGSSAGGNIIASFVTIQCNPEYSKELQISPILPPSNIVALVLEAPILDFNRASKTKIPNIINDYAFGLAASSYTGEPIIGGNKKYLKKIGLIDKVTKDFPPLYITDGNYGSFSDQAYEYSLNIAKQGIPTRVYIPDTFESHGYVSNVGSEVVQKYITDKIDFLKNLK